MSMGTTLRVVRRRRILAPRWRLVGSITTLPVFVLHKPRALSIDRRHNLGKPGLQCVNVEIETVKCLDENGRYD